jgi:hypothetical protein
MKKISKIIYVILFASTIPMVFYYRRGRISNALDSDTGNNYVFWGLLSMFIILLLIEWDKKKARKDKTEHKDKK